MTNISKAFAYVVREYAGVAQLLVMISEEAAGYEVVRGLQEADETIEQTAIREIAEEAGLEGMQIVRQIGFQMWNDEAQSFFLVNAPDGLPDNFVHTVTGTGGDSGRQFVYQWLEITPRLSVQLVEGGSAFVTELIDAVRRPI
jgi:8-oxo-dGTP pyrophosphatase MutT (NUDIX family)